MAVLLTVTFAVACIRAVQDLLFWHNRSGNGTPYLTLLLALVTGGCALAWWLTWKRNKK